jgi:putative membrane protein
MRIFAVLCAACFFAFGASAQQDNPDTPHSPQNKDKMAPAGKANVDALEAANPHSTLYQERNATAAGVLQTLHEKNLEEIAMGRLAQKNGTDRAVDYGRMLEKDHSAADAKVKALAEKKGIALKEPEMKMDEKLAGLHGADFDKASGKKMAEGHQQVIAMVEAWRTGIQDPDVKALLDDTLPVLQKHERTAEALEHPPAQGRRP